VVRWISPLAFLPGILLSFLPLLWDREMAPLYLTFGFSTIFFWLGYRYLYRNKAEMVDQNIELTQVLTRVRRYNWGKVWLISVYCFAGMSMVFFLLKQQPMLQMVLVMLLTFFVTVMAIRVEFRTRRIQETLTADSGKEWYVDEDDHWLGGIVYYNPDDSRLLINARVGINTTFNMAKTSGKVFSVMVVLLLLAMPFTGMFLHALDRQPLTLALTETTLIAHRGSKSELIDRADITEVELLLELPENMTRYNRRQVGNRDFLFSCFLKSGFGHNGCDNSQSEYDRCFYTKIINADNGCGNKSNNHIQHNTLYRFA
jgi:hypothetical protein